MANRLIVIAIKNCSEMNRFETFCVDLFVAGSGYLNKGYGTQILIDPASDNKRAIHCYEKAGFKFLRSTISPFWGLQ